MGGRGELRFPTSGANHPTAPTATLLPSCPPPTQPERGCSSLPKQFEEGALLSTAPCSWSAELREVRLQEELPPSWFLVETQFLSLDAGGGIFFSLNSPF